MPLAGPSSPCSPRSCATGPAQGASSRSCPSLFPLTCSLHAQILQPATLRLMIPPVSAPCIPPVLPDLSYPLPRGFAPSTFLMPLSFACIMGGLLTTIGTSTNLGLFAPLSALPALPGSICSSSDAHAGSAGTSMRPWMVCHCFRGWSASRHESTSQWREARPRTGSEAPKKVHRHCVPAVERVTWAAAARLLHTTAHHSSMRRGQLWCAAVMRRGHVPWPCAGATEVRARKCAEAPRRSLVKAPLV